jgi:hypothetical protein
LPSFIEPAVGFAFPTLPATRPGQALGQAPEFDERGLSNGCDEILMGHVLTTDTCCCPGGREGCFHGRDEQRLLYTIRVPELKARSHVLTGVQCHHGVYNRRDLTAYVDSVRAIFALDIYMQEAATAHPRSLFAYKPCAGRV